MLQKFFRCVIPRRTSRGLFAAALIGPALLGIGPRAPGLLGVALAEPKLYVAQHVDTAPIIDGVVTTEGEWGSSSAAAGDWAVLGTQSPEQTNNRFQAVWDEAGIYVRHEVDYGGWQSRGTDAFDFSYETLNLYFDPNVDGEPNPNRLTPDGYRLAINQPLGESMINQSFTTAGVSSEAYIDARFANIPADSYASFSGIMLHQTTSVEEEFGYTELFIPWTDFDAAENHPADTGLFHPHPPENGEQWYFNMSRLQVGATGFVSPAWDSPPGAFLASERPHGILEFVGASILPCDLTQDTACDATDIDSLTVALLENAQELIFDVNGDGTVSFQDREFYIEDVLYTYFGDSNLDGEFNSDDLLAVFQEGTYDDDIPGNSTWASGDWNGDLDFDADDLLEGFSRGGYDIGPRPPRNAAAVPEPTGWCFWIGAAWPLACLVINSRRHAITRC